MSGTSCKYKSSHKGTSNCRIRSMEHTSHGGEVVGASEGSDLVQGKTTSAKGTPRGGGDLGFSF